MPTNLSIQRRFMEPDQNMTLLSTPRARLLRATAELIYVLPERCRGQLNRFGHCREYVNRVDDVVDCQLMLDGQNCLLDNVSRVLRKNVNAQYPSGRCISNHFDQTSHVPDDDGLRHL